MIKILLILLLLPILASAQTLEKVKLQLQWKHQFEFAGFYAAKEKGFYKDFGFDVDFIEYNKNIHIVDEVVTGKVDFAVSYANVVAAHLSNQPVVLLANFFKQSPLAIVSQKEINSPAQLKNKKVMIGGNEIDSIMIYMMLSKFGLSDKDIIKIKPTFSIDDFVNKKVDAMTVFTTNEIFFLDKLGYQYNLLDPTVYGAEFYDINLFTSRKMVENFPDKTKRFKEASIKGWQYALTHKEEIINLILEKYNTQNKSRESLQFEANQIENVMLPSVYHVGAIDKNRLQLMADNFIQLGFVADKSNLNLDQFVFDDEQKGSAIILTEQERTYLNNNPVIKVSNETDFPPYDFSRAKQALGYSVDLLNLLAKKIGIKVDYVNGYSWTELVSLFKQKKLDLMQSINRTPEREKFAIFSKPYKRYKNYFIIHQDNLAIADVKQLYGKTVVVGKGWSQESYLKKHHPQINLLSVDGIVDILLTIADKKADAAIVSKEIVDYVTLKEDISGIKLSAWFKEFDKGTNRAYHFMAQKDSPELISMLNKALDSLSIQEVEQIRQKWFHNTKEKSPYVKFTKEEMHYLSNKGEIKMCIDPDWMPFEVLDNNGQYKGMAAEILELVKQRSQINLQPLKTKSWTESLEMAKSRQCDIFSLAMATPERQEYMTFTKPYMSFPFVIATRIEELFINDIEQVIDKPLAIVKGYAYSEILKNSYPEINLIEVDNILAGLKKVENKEVFGFIDALPTVAYNIQKQGMANIKISGKFDFYWELAIGARNDEPILMNIMQKALRTVTEKEKTDIYNHWYMVRYEESIDYKLVWTIFLIAAVFIAIIIYWNRQLSIARNHTQSALDSLQILHLKLENKNEELKRLVVTDRLTNVYNRFKLDEKLFQEVDRANRYNHTFSIILLDIDYFKKVNDNHGHQTGDIILKKFARLLQQNIRDTDILGRWGGEEFLIICTETNITGALNLAQSLRNKIDSHQFPVIGNQTASFGVSCYQFEEQIKSFIARADKALYQAKENGRNRVESL
ncbi:MAG: transporter substrate-binding domain-containing protein [Gammaproteobacteria bacterium]|nr:transporter substrate-binding domain-containing protein [Gammaproteobacteria bacterium]